MTVLSFCKQTLHLPWFCRLRATAGEGAWGGGRGGWGGGGGGGPLAPPPAPTFKKKTNQEIHIFNKKESLME